MSENINQKQEDVLIFASDRQAEVESLRTELIHQFPNIWLYVFRPTKPSTIWEIRAANDFGGKLKKNMLELLLAYVDSFSSEKDTLESDVININAAEEEDLQWNSSIQV